MDKKIVVVGVALAFVSAVLILGGGCSSRQSKLEELTGPAGSEAARAYDAEEERRRRADEEMRRRGEEERRARARDAERTQGMRDQIQSFESEPIYFDFNNSDLRPQYRPLLEKKAAWLKGNPEYSLKIEGHCDERGTDEYNLALGERRARVVMSYLISLGIPSGRLSTISYGEERPIAPGHDEKAWEKNRRAEFRLSR